MASANAMRRHTFMMGMTGPYFRIVWLAIYATTLVGCQSSAAPTSQYVLLERSLQPLVYQAGLWTLSFEYGFESRTSSASTSSLKIDSTLTMHDPGVKAVRITLHFVDANNKILDSEVLLNVPQLTGNPIVTNRQFSTPPGTVAISFTSSTRGRKPFDD